MWPGSRRRCGPPEARTASGACGSSIGRSRYTDGECLSGFYEDWVVAEQRRLAELCRGLEGIPLALELAGARFALMTPEQMVGALSRRFDLLVTPDNYRARRHRSVRAAMGYSLEQLTPQRRRFFASLSVFRGGWTVETAGEVCGER